MIQNGLEPKQGRSTKNDVVAPCWVFCLEKKISSNLPKIWWIWGGTGTTLKYSLSTLKYSLSTLKYSLSTVLTRSWHGPRLYTTCWFSFEPALLNVTRVKWIWICSMAHMKPHWMDQKHWKISRIYIPYLMDYVLYFESWQLFLKHDFLIGHDLVWFTWQVDWCRFCEHQFFMNLMAKFNYRYIRYPIWIKGHHQIPGWKHHGPSHCTRRPEEAPSQPFSNGDHSCVPWLRDHGQWNGKQV